MNSKVQLFENYFTLFNHKEDTFPLIFSYQEFEKIKFNNKNQYEYIYNNKKNIHRILYEEEKNILIKNIHKNILSSLFFITLLIKYNKEIINYVYDLNFIENINNYRKKSNNNLKQFLLALIIFELIKNFQLSDNYNEEEDEKEIIKKIINENEQIKIAKKNFNKINFNLNKIDIEFSNIDEIYIQIIISLIKQEKLEDYELSSEILEAMELNTINITEKMFSKLLQIFNEDKDKNFIKKYIITNIEDFFDEKKINFYYILFYYIFKNNFYIYNIPFLLKIKNFFLNIIKSDSSKLLELYTKKDEIIKKRFDYITNFLCDSKYYDNKLLDIKNKLLKEYINNKEIKQNNDDNNDNNEIQNNNNNDEKEMSMVKNLEISEYQYEETSLKVNNVIKPSDDESIYCIESNSKISQSIKDSNSIINSKIIKAEEICENSKFKENNEKENVFDEINNYNSEDKILDFSYDENFIDYIDTIGNHKESAEFIKEIGNDYFISTGKDSKLSIYDNNYKKFMDIKNQDLVSDISEFKYNEKKENKKEINIICCSNKDLSFITINIERNDSNIFKNYKNKTSSSICLQIKKNKHLICGREGAYIISDLFSKIITSQTYKILNETYKGAINLNNNLYALTSNKIFSGGEDLLKIYNSNSLKIIKQIKGYSFITSSNGLSLMPIEKSESNYNTLLCACKKYISDQKNGILLVNIQSKYPYNINYHFYDTYNFEVFCFCPILKVEYNIERILDFENDNLKITDYFLVGGFDLNKSKGIIRLYKLIKNKNIQETSIEYIKDIEIEKKQKFKGFNRPINCMLQSKKDGKLLVTSWDGNVYLFSHPKIEIILNENKLDDISLFQNEKENREIEIEA